MKQRKRKPLGAAITKVEASVIEPVAKGLTNLAMGGYDGGYYGGGNAYKACDHHRELVKIGEFTVLASGERNTKNGGLLDDPQPDMGIYLTTSWGRKLSAFTSCGMNTPTKWRWPFLVVDWPDMGVLADHELNPLLKFVEKIITSGKCVEIACFGGHGRTGTLLAMMRVRIGKMKAKEAILSLRKDYCEEVVESEKQIEAIYKVAGEPKPKFAPPAAKKPYTYTPVADCICGHTKWSHERADKDFPHLKCAYGCFVHSTPPAVSCDCKGWKVKTKTNKGGTSVVQGDLLDDDPVSDANWHHMESSVDAYAMQHWPLDLCQCGHQRKMHAPASGMCQLCQVCHGFDLKKMMSFLSEGR